MKLWLSKPKNGKPKHLVLDLTVEEEQQRAALIRRHILTRGVRPVRAQSGTKVRYRFHMKYLERIVLAFPMAEHSEGVDALVRKQEAVELDEPVPDLGEIPRFRAELWDYQKIGVKHILDALRDSGSFLLNDEVGLGKTFMAYAAMCLLDQFPVLVVCPNNAKWDAWERHGKGITDLTIQVVDGTKAQRQEQIEREADVTVVNFEMLRAVKQDDPEDGRKKIIKPTSNPALFEQEYGLLVTDEYHRVKNPNAQQTIGYMNIKTDMELHMSGTPIMSRPDEIWPTLHRLDKERFSSHYMFEKAITLRENGRIIGYDPKSMKDLRDYIAEKSLRRRKEQVVNELPQVLEIPHFVDLTPEQRRLYNRINDDFMLEFEEGEPKRIHYRTQIMRLKQACFSPELYGGSATSAKINEMKEVVRQLVDNGEKAIIFSQWAKATRIIEREFADYNPAYVDGSVKGRDRIKQVDKFNNDPECYLYIGTIGANRESITLNAATYVIFADKEWTPAANHQAIGRSAAGGLRGLGVTVPVHVIYLLGRNTVEERIEEMLQGKQAVFNALIERDGGAEPVRITMNELRGLLEGSETPSEAAS